MYYIGILTYGGRRLALLERAVGSALLQKNAVVIVFNDCPQHTLICHNDRVHIINSKYSFMDIGDKRLSLIHNLNKSDVLQWLDDDDIIMPWAERRIEKTIEASWTNPTMLYKGILQPITDTSHTRINFSFRVGLLWHMQKAPPPEDKSMRDCFKRGNTHGPSDYILHRHNEDTHLSETHNYGSDCTNIHRLVESNTKVFLITPSIDHIYITGMNTLNTTNQKWVCLEDELAKHP